MKNGLSIESPSKRDEATDINTAKEHETREYDDDRHLSGTQACSSKGEDLQIQQEVVIAVAPYFRTSLML